MSVRSDLFVWLDLEMTGLDPRKHHIVEIATIITDNKLNVIAEGPELVIHQPEHCLENLDPWVMQTHTKSGLFEKIRQSQYSLAAAEAITLEFLKQHTTAATAPLCGNSIGTDRGFLQHAMPDVYQHLHYRNIDVSSIKILYQAWNATRPTPNKQMRHRALDDIKESIAELAFYRRHFFITSSDCA